MSVALMEARRGMRGLRGKLLLSALAFALCFAVGELTMRLLRFDQNLEFEVDPALYWKFRPNQRGFLWMGGGTFRSPSIRINAQGLRGPEPGPRSNEKLRVLSLGDSYTFGSGVRDDETFSAVLQRQIGSQRIEVINGGVIGYGIFQMVELFRRLAPQLRPDVVILTIPTGDILRQPFATQEEERGYLSAQARAKKLRAVSRFGTFLYRQFVIVHSRLTGTWKGSANRIRTDDPDFAALWEKDQRRLVEVADLCESLRATLVVMAWPQGRREWDIRLKKGVQELAERGNVIGLVDLDRTLRESGEDHLKIPGDGHPSAAAHAVAGRYLAPVIQNLLESNHLKVTRSQSQAESAFRSPPELPYARERLIHSCRV